VKSFKKSFAPGKNNDPGMAAAGSGLPFSRLVPGLFVAAGLEMVRWRGRYRLQAVVAKIANGPANE